MHHYFVFVQIASNISPFDTETIAAGRRENTRGVTCKRHVEESGAGEMRCKVSMGHQAQKEQGEWGCAVGCASFN